MRKFINYGKQYIDKKDIDSIIKVLKSDYLTQGPQIKKLEDSLAKYVGAKYCIAVANGTAALHLAVASLDIPKKMYGLTTPISFVASTNCLLYNHLRPLFTDIQKDTYNIDPVQIKKLITNKTKVIIPVHFAGQTADMNEINKLKKKHNIYIIEDGAHAIGSKYSDGNRVGCCKYSDLTTFSFHPVKTMTSGEGGAITTNNKKIYQKLLILRNHGITKDKKLMKKNPGPWYYEMQMLGFNYRMNDLQAALALSQLNKIGYFVKRRRQIVNKYNKAFSNNPYIQTPFEKKGVSSCFHLYILLIDFNAIKKSRKQVMNKLLNEGIQTQVHYIPIYHQPYYKKNFNFKKDQFLNSEEYYKKALSIPLFPSMTNADVNYVIKNIFEVIS